MPKHRIMKTYRGRGGKPLRTRNIRIKCRQVVSFVLLSLHTWRKSPRYLFDWRLEGGQDRSGHSGGEAQNSGPLGESNFGRIARSQSLYGY